MGRPFHGRETMVRLCLPPPKPGRGLQCLAPQDLLILFEEREFTAGDRKAVTGCLLMTWHSLDSSEKGRIHRRIWTTLARGGGAGSGACWLTNEYASAGGRVPLERRGGGLAHSENADKPVGRHSPACVTGFPSLGLELGAQKGLSEQPP